MMEWPLVTRDLSGGAKQVADPVHEPGAGITRLSGPCRHHAHSYLEGLFYPEEFSSNTMKTLHHRKTLR
jgi:hypothetical protein